MYFHYFIFHPVLTPWLVIALYFNEGHRMRRLDVGWAWHLAAKTWYYSFDESQTEAGVLKLR